MSLCHPHVILMYPDGLLGVDYLSLLYVLKNALELNHTFEKELLYKKEG